jgi:hypothetical protein
LLAFRDYEAWYPRRTESSPAQLEEEKERRKKKKKKKKLAQKRTALFWVVT